MDNKIDYVITLDDNTKYMILDQGNYDGKSYFYTSRIDENENLTNDFNILEETITNDLITVKTVEQEDLLEALVDYFKSRFTVVA